MIISAVDRHHLLSLQDFLQGWWMCIVASSFRKVSILVMMALLSLFKFLVLKLTLCLV